MELLTASEVAKRLRVEVSTVRRWARKGALEVIVLPHVNKRRQIRIRRTTIDALLDPVL